MKNTLCFIGLFLVFLVLVNASATFWATYRIMEDAYERGLAFKCPGIIGYHWECPASGDIE